MQNLNCVVAIVHVEQRIDQQVQRIERSCLTLCNERVTKAAAVIPERKFAVRQPLGKELLLRKKVSVSVSADEPPARPERLPENNRQPDRKRDDTQRLSTRDAGR